MNISAYVSLLISIFSFTVTILALIISLGFIRPWKLPIIGKLHPVVHRSKPKIVKASHRKLRKKYKDKQEKRYKRDIEALSQWHYMQCLECQHVARKKQDHTTNGYYDDPYRFYTR